MKKNLTRLFVYTLRYGMYNAVEFIYFGETNPEEDTYVIACKRSYSEIGFATNITKYKDIDMIKEYGFDANAENTEPHPFYTKEAQDAFDKAELERAIR